MYVDKLKWIFLFQLTCALAQKVLKELSYKKFVLPVLDYASSVTSTIK